MRSAKPGSIASFTRNEVVQGMCAVRWGRGYGARMAEVQRHDPLQLILQELVRLPWVREEADNLTNRYKELDLPFGLTRKQLENLMGDDQKAENIFAMFAAESKSMSALDLLCCVALLAGGRFLGALYFSALGDKRNAFPYFSCWSEYE